jgi:hypothetical protein
MVYSSFLNEPDFRPIKTLSCALPSLQQLRHLRLAAGGSPMNPATFSIVEHVLAIGRSLKAWPPPFLELFHSVPLGTCWRGLDLPAEAAAWDKAQILDFFRVQ